MQKLGMEKFPVIMVEMGDAKRRAFAAADKKTREIANLNTTPAKDCNLMLEVL